MHASNFTDPFKIPIEPLKYHSELEKGFHSLSRLAYADGHFP